MVYPHNELDLEYETRPKKRKRKKRKKLSKNTKTIKQKQKTEEIEIPDYFAVYMSIKFREKWEKFVKYADSIDKIEIGISRLLDILRSGDDDDVKFFNMLPVSFFECFNVSIELTTGEVLGSEELSWDKLKGILIENKMKESREIPSHILGYLNSNKTILKALDIFGGKIIGYVDDNQSSQ